MSAPRLFVLTAAEAPRAVVLRRGSAREVATIGWDRKRETVEPGQWLRGRIYEHRSDLSPDGRHLIVFAGKGGSRWWTAVSRAPWLTALVYLPQSSTWGGGGAFTGPGRVWLNGGGALPTNAPRELRSERDPRAYPSSTDGFHMGGTYAAMKERRGWRSDGMPAYGVTLWREMADGVRIELTIAVGQRGRALISERYALVRPGAWRHEMPGWEWAEPWEDGVQFAEAGALWFATVLGDGGLADRRCLHDFTAMRFEARRAPYRGLRA